MKAITVWQPWASLLACGAKKYETRSWATSYRGPIAIHAAVRKCDTSDIAARAVHGVIQALHPITSKLAKTTVYLPLELLPRGCIIATAELVGCHRIDSLYKDGVQMLAKATWNGQVHYEPISTNELLFGDLTPGRFAWEMANVQMLDNPIPAKGKQGLWNWEQKGA